jgi:inner membrane transporter RhtA
MARAPSSALVLGAMISVQLGAAVAIKQFDRLGPGGTVLLRLASASVILLLLFRPRLRGRPRRELILAVTFGFVLAAMNSCFYEALDRIPLGVTVTIEFVGPLAVAITGSRRAIDVVWVVLAASGIVALTQGDAAGLDNLGVVFALLAGALWAVYIVLNARLGRAFESATGLTIALCVSTVVALPLGVAQAGAQLLTPRALLLGSLVGLLASAIPYSFELEALRRIKPAVFGVLMSLEPAIAAIIGFVFLSQGLSARAVAGIAMVVVASIGASRQARAAPVAV